ncbi:hypothetical protein B0J11DRAFT_65408 [Dendryphion nanum]|uniref:Zn(2)-C6 fungal-type domain-containing protein n=1 Tax=Dendryphion nanum TaxID=256645 RepID=A0A9P9IGX7_9PLEO|nr:hypothetical protein B0J11DRAFT_65408 [Dendryphion nanum]
MTMRKGKKVKTGCRTCKLRKVKCDEGKPVCHRCRSTNRICEGYGIWGGGGNTYAERYPMTRHCTGMADLPVPSPPSVGSPMFPFASIEEREYLDWFIGCTVTRFPGIFGSSFWHTLVLPASTAEPAVYHAVVALSSAHRQELNAALSKPETNEHFTLQQYSKSIGHLQLLLGSGSDKRSTALALITCLLFTFLENFRGDYTTASSHLENGLKLLCELHSHKVEVRAGTAIIKPLRSVIDIEIMETFARLHTQSDLFHPPSRRLDIILAPSDIETFAYPIFSSVGQARDSLDKLLHAILLAVKRRQLGHAEEPCLHRMMAEHYTSVWFDRYWATMNLPQPLSDKDAAAYKLLHIYYKMTRIMITSAFCIDEMEYDHRIPEFVSILSESIEFVKQIESTSLDLHLSESSNSIGDIGWIPPLYLTALKCRNPQIRRQAIKILGSRSHKEGIWNSKTVTIAATKIVELEELNFYQGMDLGESLPWDASPIDLDHSWTTLPKFSRLHEVEMIMPEGANRKLELTYKQELYEGGVKSFGQHFDGISWSSFEPKR